MHLKSISTAVFLLLHFVSSSEVGKGFGVVAGKSLSGEESKGRSLFGPSLEFGIGGTKFSIGGTLHGLGGLGGLGFPGQGWGWRPFPSPHFGGFHGGHGHGVGFGLHFSGHGHGYGHHHNLYQHQHYKHQGYGYNLGWGWGSPYLPYFH